MKDFQFISNNRAKARHRPILRTPAFQAGEDEENYMVGF